jgi:hypothetical protein
LLPFEWHQLGRPKKWKTGIRLELGFENSSRTGPKQEFDFGPIFDEHQGLDMTEESILEQSE